uniref:Uncharacterized protein n=1 Tax=Anguilla anguilla TaxID=7936 RepID=A0A0E9WYE9_ANGAN
MTVYFCKQWWLQGNLSFPRFLCSKMGSLALILYRHLFFLLHPLPKDVMHNLNDALFCSNFPPEDMDDPK